MAGELVVIAEFSVGAQHRQEFLEACALDSRSSRGSEPGCRQFDAVTSKESEGTVVLYEVYDDQAAFEEHLATPHYASFAEAVERLKVNKIQVRTFTRQ